MNSIPYYQSLLLQLYSLKGNLSNLTCSLQEKIVVEASINRLIQQIEVQMSEVEKYESKHRTT